jgi:hypothetical protein
MIGETSGWCMVCIRKGVENEFAVVCGKANGRCEVRSLIRHDEVRDMGHFVPMGENVY